MDVVSVFCRWISGFPAAFVEELVFFRDPLEDLKSANDQKSFWVMLDVLSLT
jgi:hypothetical protein